MSRKRNPNRWPIPRPATPPPPPQGDDGPARLVAWIEVQPCAGCAGVLAWRDQYLRSHCRNCEPPPGQRGDIPEPPPPTLLEEMIQLSLF